MYRNNIKSESKKKKKKRENGGQQQNVKLITVFNFIEQTKKTLSNCGE